MSRVDLISRVRRLGPKLAVFILGDRALLRPGGASALSRLLGLRTSLAPDMPPAPHTRAIIPKEILPTKMARPWCGIRPGN